MRRPQSDIIEAVLTNEDLVTQIFRGTIGPSTFAAISRVCKLWHSVCRSDETVLRMVALYQGGLTKTVFCGLFAMVPRDATALPHTVQRRRNGGSYYIFGKAAIDAVLVAGGMPALRVRVAKRAAVVACLGHGVLHELSVGVGRSTFEQARLEELLHVRTCSHVIECTDSVHTGVPTCRVVDRSSICSATEDR